METTVVQDAYMDRLLRRIIKRYDDKPLATKLVARRSFGSAISILENLKGIDLKRLYCEVNNFECFVFSEKFSEPCRKQLELAITDNEKFVLGLHGFYTEIATIVKSENSFGELALFIASVIKANTTSGSAVLRNIADAYANLVLEVIEYIRPNKLDITRDVRGISVNGNVLTGRAIHPYSDLPLFESVYELSTKKTPRAQNDAKRKVLRRYHDLGIPIKDIQDITSFEMLMQRMSNEYASILPFINEYTYDILPQTQSIRQEIPFENIQIHSKYSNNYLVEALMHKVHTLPPNGTKFIFENTCDGAKSLLMKEVVVNNRVQILYRLCTIYDDFFGCCEPASNYLFSVLQFTCNSPAANNFESIFLNLYASQVLDFGNSQDFFIAQKDEQGVFISVPIKVEKMDGPLINWYDRIEHPNDPPAPPLLNRVNAEIRRLPAGVEIPDKVKKIAQVLGYDLKPGEVLLLPYRLDEKIQTFKL